MIELVVLYFKSRLPLFNETDFIFWITVGMLWLLFHDILRLKNKKIYG